MQNFATSFGGFISVPAVSFFILFAAIIFACWRCNSLLPITKLWCQKVLGEDGYKSELLKSIDNQVDDVLRFNVLYGASFRTFEKLERFHKRVASYSLDIPTLMRAKSYFSCYSLKVRKRSGLDVALVFFLNLLAAAFFVFSFLFFVPLIAEKSFLVEFEHDGNWFLINEERIHSSNYMFNSSTVKDWSFAINSCNEDEINKVAKLSKETIKIVCGVAKNDKEKKYLRSEIKSQSRTYMLLSFIGLGVFAISLAFLLKYPSVKEARKHVLQQYKNKKNKY